MYSAAVMNGTPCTGDLLASMYCDVCSAILLCTVGLSLCTVGCSLCVHSAKPKRSCSPYLLCCMVSCDALCCADLAVLKVSNQARWAVLQAYTLIRQNKKALDAVVAALKEGKKMGDVALAIEASVGR